MADKCWVCLNCNHWMHDTGQDSPICKYCGHKMINGYIDDMTRLPIGMTAEKPPPTMWYARSRPNWVRAIAWTGMYYALQVIWYGLLLVLSEYGFMDALIDLGLSILRFLYNVLFG